MIAIDTNVLVYALNAETTQHDVALCREHGISIVLTNDRDFERFKDISVDYL